MFLVFAHGPLSTYASTGHGIVQNLAGTRLTTKGMFGCKLSPDQNCLDPCILRRQLVRY